jgi:hypothetical protein
MVAMPNIITKEGLLSVLKDVAAIMAVIVAATVAIRGVCEYQSQGRQKRAEHFLSMRHRFKDDETFKTIGGYLEFNDDKLREVLFADKRDYIGFFEEIALLVKSGLMTRRSYKSYFAS